MAAEHTDSQENEPISPQQLRDAVNSTLDFMSDWASQNPGKTQMSLDLTPNPLGEAATLTRSGTIYIDFDVFGAIPEDDESRGPTQKLIGHLGGIIGETIEAITASIKQQDPYNISGIWLPGIVLTDHVHAEELLGHPGIVNQPLTFSVPVLGQFQINLPELRRRLDLPPTGTDPNIVTAIGGEISQAYLTMIHKCNQRWEWEDDKTFVWGNGDRVILSEAIQGASKIEISDFFTTGKPAFKAQVKVMQPKQPQDNQLARGAAERIIAPAMANLFNQFITAVIYLGGSKAMRGLIDPNIKSYKENGLIKPEEEARIRGKVTVLPVLRLYLNQQAINKLGVGKDAILTLLLLPRDTTIDPALLVTILPKTLQADTVHFTGSEILSMLCVLKPEFYQQVIWPVINGNTDLREQLRFVVDTSSITGDTEDWDKIRSFLNRLNTAITRTSPNDMQNQLNNLGKDLSKAVFDHILPRILSIGRLGKGTKR